MAHARLSPSSSKMWLNCPGSIEASESIPDVDNQFSKEGTAGHEVFKRAVRSGKHPREWLGVVFEGVKITLEIIEHVAEAWEWVQAYLVAHPGTLVFSEYEVDMGLAFGLPLGPNGKSPMWGTGDLFLLNPTELVTFDLKLGFIDVEVEGNSQIALYSMGFLLQFKFFDIERVRHVIYQPKSEGYKEDVLTVEELRYLCSALRPAVRAALKPGAPRRPSEAACRWCKAAPVCPELRAQADSITAREFTPEFLGKLSNEKVGELLNQADMIRNLLKAVEAYAYRSAQAGQKIPGYKLVYGKRKRVWKSPELAKGHLGSLGFAEDQYAPRELVSPAQAEALIGKKNKKALAEFIDTPQGEPKLAPESDPRPEVAADFEAVSDEEVKKLTEGSSVVGETIKGELV